MGVLDKIEGLAGAATPPGLASAGAGGLIGAIGGIIGQFHTSPADKEKWAEFQATLVAHQQDLAQQLVVAQADVDKAEAASPNMFIAGWRPFVGWVCGTGLAYGLVLQPFATFIATVAHRTLDPKQLPTLDVATLIGLLIPMLGLGAYRTYEKTQGVADKH